MTSQVENVDYSSEFRRAFGEYGIFVNASRAFPDVRDGLKPVHRRILWAMWKNTTIRQGGKVKAAKAVGDTMGDYHPHGDSAIYGTMVGMAQPFTIQTPLVKGFGNWGSLDDAPAAYRYTECSLAPAAHAILGVLPDSNSTISETDENGVEMMDNYTGNLLEPVVLPALWPAFVVNGSEGIGVGASQHSASHNLAETLDLAIHMVDSPNPRWETISRILPGPDLPADCDIFDSDYEGIKSYFLTGAGSFVMRARYTIEEYDISRKQKGHIIVFRGLPHKVSPEMVVENVRWMIDKEQLPPVEVSNMSTADIRVEIDVKDYDVNDVLQRLLYHSKSSRLQQHFHVSMNAIVDGSIKTVGVIEALNIWIAHRRTVIKNRSRFRLDKAKSRLHLVEGYLKAIPIAEEIVTMARASASKKEASASMQQKWGFSELQADAILEMTISQITKMGVDKYLDEKAKLEAIIDDCTQLLTDPAYLNTRLKEEMRAVSRKYGVPRRATLVPGSAAVDRPETPAVEAPVVNGYIVKTGRNWVRWAVQAGRVNPIVGNDHVVASIKLTDQNKMDAVSNMGWHYRVFAADVPDKMTRAEAMFPRLDSGEKFVMVDSAAPWGEGTNLVVIAESKDSDPVFKMLDWDTWSSLVAGKERSIITLEDGAQVTQAFLLPKGQDIGVLTAMGRMLKLNSDSVNPKGRSARGNPLIKLTADDDKIIWAGAVTDKDQLVYWNTEESVARFPIGKVEYSGRNTQGKSITRTDFYLAGARLGDGSANRLGHFNGDIEAALYVSFDDIREGESLSDRQITTQVKGIRKSDSIWLDTVAE